MTEELHPVALRVLEAIAAGWHERGLPPTVHDITERCGLGSTTSAHYWIGELVHEGLADVREDGEHSVRLTARGREVLRNREDA